MTTQPLLRVKETVGDIDQRNKRESENDAEGNPGSDDR